MLTRSRTRTLNEMLIAYERDEAGVIACVCESSNLIRFFETIYYNFHDFSHLGSVKQICHDITTLLEDSGCVSGHLPNLLVRIMYLYEHSSVPTIDDDIF